MDWFLYDNSLRPERVKQRKYLSFMELKVLVFSIEGFWFFKFNENEPKHDKRNFKRSLAVKFEVENSQNYWKK